MGNQTQNSSHHSKQRPMAKDLNFQNSNDANIQCSQEFDNPKRKILDSNFLAGLNYSSNNLQNICQKQNVSPEQSTRRFSLIKIDSIVLDNQIEPCPDQDDAIKQSAHFAKIQKRFTISFPLNLNELRDKTLFREIKNYIVSAKNLYDPIQVQSEKFINIRYQNVLNSYILLQKIGEGSYGNVHKAQCLRTKQLRAIKILKKNKQNQKQKHYSNKDLQQLEILRTLDHPNIVKLYQVFFYESFYLVTQFCEGGSILSYLRYNKMYSELIVKTIIKQLLSALCYMHSMKIAHRDIKMDNIVFIKKINAQSQTEDIEIKIIDFGESLRLKFSHNNRDSKEIGTITYMAPQVLQGLYSEKCDIWSCGIILWILLSGRNPFKRSSKTETLNCIRSKQIQFRGSDWQDVSQNTKSLLRKMLQKNPLLRISAKQALKNSWFSQKDQCLNPLKMKQVVTKLYHYYRGNNLVSVVESYLTFLKITQEQRIQLTKLFKHIDKDNSGNIDAIQLREAFGMCSQEHDEQIDYVLKKIDKNKSKKIDLNEFITAFYGRKKLFHENSLEIAFDYFDNDRNGFIDKSQMMQVLKGCKQEQINRILQDIDQNGDQKISKEEFVTYIRQQRFL